MKFEFDFAHEWWSIRMVFHPWLWPTSQLMSPEEDFQKFLLFA
jgi:hypothetical protein